MLQLLRKIELKNVKYKIQCINEIKRYISALYITGDKANEHYVTLQPYMDFAETFKDTEALKSNIESRKLNTNLAEVLNKYEKYTKLHHKVAELEEKRGIIADQLKKLLKNADPKNDAHELKEKGKNMRNELKKLKETLYPVEDDFVHAYLNLPNILHKSCPTTEAAIVYKQILQKDTGKNGDINKLAKFVDENRYYLLEDAALFDLHSMQSMQNYIIQEGDFIPVANPDFVRCVLLEANATPLNNYHQVVEENLQNKINTAYLMGGGAFDSFLGAVTKLSVYPSVMPLRWVSCGRSYKKPSETVPQTNLYNVCQSNAVQVFVATISAADADAELQNIINVCINFYKEMDIPFRIVYNKASDLTLSECLRASIEVYSPALKSYMSVGYISNYSNFISKRILFNVRDKAQYHFPHVIGGPILITTRLIAALNEYEIPFKMCKLLGDFEVNAHHEDKFVKKTIN